METLSRKLIDMGVDVFSVVKRLGGNEALYLTICNKFVRDPSYQTLQEAIMINDFQSAELTVHTLKGVAANLGFIRLENISKSLLQDLRENRLTTLQEDNYCLAKEYERIMNVLTGQQSD